MGPDDETPMPGRYEVIDAQTGESLGWHELGEGEYLPELTFAEPVPAEDNEAGTYEFRGWLLSNQIAPSTLTATLTIPKRHRCKTRKRFIKLLMADGISRNSANELAWLVRHFYRSYWDAYLDHKLFGLKK